MLSSAGRFSSTHTFLLFNDCFVHLQVCVLFNGGHPRPCGISLQSLAGHIVTLFLGLPHVKNTLGNTSTPVFSVDTVLLCFLPAHASFLLIQFFSGLHFVEFASQCMTCCSSLPLSICKTCQYHLSLVSLIISFNFCAAVFSLTFSFLTLSLKEMPSAVPVAEICHVLLLIRQLDVVETALSFTAVLFY